MTKPRYDNHSTEFGLWLREQEEIDSKLGFVTTNLDYIWSNYKTGDFMLLEEKRYFGKITYSQQQIFNLLHSICKNHSSYKGFHKIIFEKTNPNDGRIWLNKKKISKEELLEFLKFNFRIDKFYNIIKIKKNGIKKWLQ